MKNIWMDWVLNVFLFDIIFIKYYIIQIKIFMVKLEQEKLRKFKVDTYYGTEGVNK